MRFKNVIKRAAAALAAGIIMLSGVTAKAETVNVTVGDAISYPSGMGYMTHYFYMDGHPAYCFQPRLGPMSSGQKEVSYISSEGEDGYPLLVKVLACGYGGPNDLTLTYFPGASDKDRYIYTHIAAGYAYMTAKESQSTLNDITGLTNEQFESSGLGDFVRAAWNTNYSGVIKVVKTEQYQDIGYLFSYTDNSYVPPTYTYEVSVTKTDTELLPLSGAIFGIYSDPDCNNLIAKLPETDENGKASLTLTNSSPTLYLKEITAPYGYEKDLNAVAVTPSDSKKSFVNKEALGRIILHKKDSETGKSRGDATLEGAVYELRADNEITDINGNVIYAKGDLVKEFVTDESGTDSVDNLRPGEYVIKEVTAPKGYRLDDKEYPIAVTYDSDKGVISEINFNVGDDIYKGSIEINKTKTDNPDVKIAHAGFRAYLVSSLKEDGNGGYDFTDAKPVILTQDGKDILYTDENGYAQSIELPYGTYLVREEDVPKNYLKVKDFQVTVSETSEAVQVVKLTDEPYRIRIRINKYDGESGNRIIGNVNEGASFAIYDTVNDRYVEKGIKLNNEGVGYSSKLESGSYRLEEECAPYGYAKSLDYVYFCVDDEENVIFDLSHNEEVIDVSFYNVPFKGQIAINKYGKVISGFNKGDEANLTSGNFKFTKERLKGVEFGLYAQENVYYPDGRCDENGQRIIQYAKDEKIEDLITGEDGVALSGIRLNVGKYYIKEEKTLNGYVPMKDKQIFEVRTEATSEEIYELITLDVVNEPVGLSAVVIKKDVTDGKPLMGAYFSLYADNDICDSFGNIIAERGTYLETAISGSDGKAYFSNNLPEGDYYVREIIAPSGYGIDTRPYRFTLQRADEAYIEVCEFYDMPKSEKKPGTIVLGATYSKTGTNNYTTDDIGVEGFSVIKSPQSNRSYIIVAVIMTTFCVALTAMVAMIKRFGGK